jgi:predicted amidohydrolase YtcJ
LPTVPPEATLIVTNGDVHTMDPARPRARALAAVGETIVAVGSDEEIRPLGGLATEVIDLGGRTVVPGLIDAHVHLLSLGQALGRLDFERCRTLEQALDVVRRAHREQPEGWLLGRGFHPNRWARWPTRQDLDAVVGDRRCAFSSHDGHSLWASSGALRAAGLSASTGTPAGGEIFREPDGHPTGVLQETAIPLVESALGQPTAADLDAALTRAVRHCNERGLVGVHTVESADSFAGVQRLRGRGQLSLRVQAHLWRDGLDHALALGLRTGLGDDWLRVGGLKLFADGALGSRTALMLEPYEGEPGNRGLTVLTRAELLEHAEWTVRAGIALTVHAIGDEANRYVLDAIAHAREVAGKLGAAAGPALRHRIEHAQIVHKDDYPRFGRLGVVASMQPTHATTDIEYADRYWGARSAHAYAWRTMLEHGAALAFGSDAPVESVDPLPGIHAAVTRRRAGGTPRGGWYPEQRLTVEEAVRAFTLGAAYAAGEEARKGSLTPGKVADLTVLSRDVFTIPPAEILETRVVRTIVGGRSVYEAAPAERR